MRLILDSIKPFEGDNYNSAKHIKEFNERQVMISIYVFAFLEHRHLAELEALVYDLVCDFIFWVGKAPEELVCMGDGEFVLWLVR